MTKKIGFVSDVHLEFGHLDLNNKDNLDILILAGDISTPHAWKWNHNSSARKTKDIQMKFFKNIADQFPKIIYIPGNHEHYHGDYMDTEKLLQTNLAQFPNIQVGNHLVHEDNDFVIIGDTLWTDFDNNNSITMLKSQVGMNDFRLIYLDRSFLNPRDVFVIHRTALANIANDIARFPDKKIIVVSSAPQIRYPDCYGIDMSKMKEFVAFRAALALLKERNLEHILDEVNLKCLLALENGTATQENFVKAIYAPFTDQEISDKIAEIVKPKNLQAELSIVYQTVENLNIACPNHLGDWYFTGNFPTPGGNQVVNKSFVNFMKGIEVRAY